MEFDPITKLVLIFSGILLIVIGYYGMKNGKPKKVKKQEDPMNDVFKNAGIGSSKEILKQRASYEDLFEQKPGEIFDNIFNGRIIGLLSS